MWLDGDYLFVGSKWMSNRCTTFPGRNLTVFFFVYRPLVWQYVECDAWCSSSDPALFAVPNDLFCKTSAVCRYVCIFRVFNQQYLDRVAVDSEPMLDDSARSLETKDRFRQGKIGGAEFARIIAELKRTGTDRIEYSGRRNATAAGAGPAGIAGASGLTVSTASTTPMVAEPWQGRDGGAEGSRCSEFGLSGLKHKRPANATGVLSKLGGRLVAGLTTPSLKADQVGGSNSAQSSSPAGERARSEAAGAMRRLRSPRRSSVIGSPRHNQEPGTSESNTASGSWRPWNVPGTANRRPIVQSPERPAPSPAGTGTPVRGGNSHGTLLQGRQTSPASSQVQHMEHGGVGGDGGAGSTTGSAPPGPLTASEIDNMSSVSMTSTVLTDLSSRMEKIEVLLSRLLDANTGGRGDGGGGGNDVLQRWGRVGQQGQGVGHDNDPGSSEGGGGAGRVAPPGSRYASHLLPGESAGEVTGAVKDTAGELRLVRRRLLQLEMEEAAARAAGDGAGAGAGASAASSTAPPAPTTVAPRSPQPSPTAAESKLAQPASSRTTAEDTPGDSIGKSGGDHLIPGGGPASELPTCGNDSFSEEALLPLSSAAMEEQLQPSSSRTMAAGAGATANLSHLPISSVHTDQGDYSNEAAATISTSRAAAATQGGVNRPPREPERDSHHREREEEEKGVGLRDIGEQAEAKGDEPDSGSPMGPSRGSLSDGNALPQIKSYGLSPISEGPL